MKVLKIIFEKLIDFQLEDKVCRRLICELLVVQNDVNSIFIDVFRKDLVNEIVQSFVLYVKEELLFCFVDGSFDVVIIECLLLCFCKGKVVFIKNFGS